jgi:16S rRNA processing protein RimM
VSSTVEVVVGRVGKPHGVRGEVTVEVRTDEPERRFFVGATLLAQPPRGSASGLTSLEVVASRWHQSTLLVRFAEIGDRTAAEGARNTLLLAEVPADRSPEDPEEFYDHQLVGMTVVDLEQAVIGEIAGVVHGAQDLLEVRATDGRTTLVPFVAALVPEVDVAAGRVVVADRPGLVAPYADEPPEG